MSTGGSILRGEAKSRGRGASYLLLLCLREKANGRGEVTFHLGVGVEAAGQLLFVGLS